MNDLVKVSCTISNTDNTCPLGMEIWLDDLQIFNSTSVDSTIDFVYDIPENDSNHELKFTMTGKNAQHTQLDIAGNIVKDARLIIENLSFDDIPLGQVFIDHAEYTHDFNGTKPTTQEKFYGEMGCNGTVSLKFSTPTYLWLLEHM